MAEKKVLVRKEDLRYATDFNQALRYALYESWGTACHHCEQELKSATRTQIDHLIPKTLRKDAVKMQEVLDYVGRTQSFDLDCVENLAPIHGDCNGPNGKGQMDLSATGYLMERLKKAEQRGPEVRRKAASLLNSDAMQKALATVESYSHFEKKDAIEAYEDGARFLLQALQDNVPTLFGAVIVEQKHFDFSLEEVVSEVDVPTEVGVGLGLTAADQSTLGLLQSVTGESTEELMQRVLRKALDAARPVVEQKAAESSSPDDAQPGGAIFNRFDVAIDRIVHTGNCDDAVELRILARGSADVIVVYGIELEIQDQKEIDIRTPMDLWIHFPENIRSGPGHIKLEIDFLYCKTETDSYFLDWATHGQLGGQSSLSDDVEP